MSKILLFEEKNNETQNLENKRKTLRIKYFQYQKQISLKKRERKKKILENK